MKNKIKDPEEKINNNMTSNILEGKLDIKPIKKEMNKLIELGHERNKRSLNLTIFYLKEEGNKDMLVVVKEKLHNK